MTEKMTRKDFLRIAGLTALATGTEPTSAATELTLHRGSDHFRADGKRARGPLIRSLDPVIRLHPAGAVQRQGDIRYGPAEIDAMLPFFGDGETTWNITAPVAGAYRVAACYSSMRPDTRVEVVCGSSSIRHTTVLTEGFYLPYPGGPAANPGTPDKDSFWSERQLYNFERIPLSGELQLSCGVNVVSLRVSAPKGGEIFRLRSLELTPVTLAAAVLAASEAGRRQRVNTDWFVKAAYGVWFHFLDLTTPRRGPRKPYAQAVADLDVAALASLVEETGAGYVVFTVNHGDPTCPAPIRSWEELHPGWTTQRDLIADLAEALNRRGIRLLLYMNGPGIGSLQVPGRALDQPKYSEERFAEILVRVFTEFGLRYGNRVAGYWLDAWLDTTEFYPNLPLGALSRAIRAGYPDRMVAYNYWAFPIESDWQDYWAGELTDLPLKRFGSRYIRRGAGKGLQAHSAIRLDDPWLHITPNTAIQAPRYTAAQLTEYIRTCMEDQAVVTFGVGIYQDGTIGEASQQVLRDVRRAIRGT
jgi:hypothetical protein